MNNIIYEHCVRVKIPVEKAVMLFTVLFSLVAGFTCRANAEGEDTRKTVAAESSEQKTEAATGGKKQDEIIGKTGGKTVAATVNGAVITEDSVIKQMKTLAARKEQGEEAGDLRTRALDSLIFLELAIQKARAEGLTVEQKTIDEAVEKIKTSYGGVHGYQAFLEKEALTEEGLREILERSYLLKLVLAREVSGKVTVKEDDLKEEYEKNKEKYLKPERVTVTDVVFFLKVDDADSIKKVEAIVRKINDDEEKNPRNLVPDSTFLVRELELRKDEEPELYEAAKTLRSGEVSGVIRASDSLHIIKLTEYIPERQQPLEEVRRSLDTKLLAEAKRKRVKEFEAELKKEAQIVIIKPGELNR